MWPSETRLGWPFHHFHLPKSWPTGNKYKHCPLKAKKKKKKIIYHHLQREYKSTRENIMTSITMTSITSPLRKCCHYVFNLLILMCYHVSLLRHYCEAPSIFFLNNVPWLQCVSKYQALLYLERDCGQWHLNAYKFKMRPTRVGKELGYPLLVWNDQ